MKLQAQGINNIPTHRPLLANRRTNPSSNFDTVPRSSHAARYSIQLTICHIHMVPSLPVGLVYSFSVSCSNLEKAKSMSPSLPLSRSMPTAFSNMTAANTSIPSSSYTSYPTLSSLFLSLSASSSGFNLSSPTHFSQHRVHAIIDYGDHLWPCDLFQVLKLISTHDL